MAAIVKKNLPSVAVFVGLLFVRQDLGVDIWFMLNNGQYIMAHGFPHVEPFTIHKNLDYIVQQWLTCVIFRQVYDLFGYAGLVWLARIAGAVILWGYYRLCVAVSGGNRTLSAMLTALVGTMVCLIFVYPRPVIFSTPIFIAEVWLLEQAAAKPRCLWLLPLLALLLVNFHAAMFPMFFVLMLPYLAASVRLKALDAYVVTGFNLPLKILFMAAAASVAVAFCNPYGSEALLYGINSYGYAAINRLVGEMHPLTVNTPLFIIPAAFLLFLLPAYGRKSVPLQYVLLTLGTAYMAMAAIRSELLFLVFGTLGAAYVLREKKFAASVGGNIRRRLTVALTVFIVAVLVLTVGKKDNYRYEEYYYGEIYKPAADYLASLPEGTENIRLMSEYNSGSYFEFRGIKCYIDSRAEVFLKVNNHRKNIFHEYSALYWGDLPYRKFLWRYDFTHVFVADNNPIFYQAMATDPDWELVFEFDYGRNKNNPKIGRIYRAKKVRSEE